jgi:cytoskeletal protein CcmA (bactofilin family)
MAAIFQIRRGTSNVSLTEGELYLHQGSGSLQFGSGSTKYNTLTLDAPVKGDINLIGNISASGDVRIGGNIYLGDSAASDNISALGIFTTNLVPNGTIDLGTTSAKWNNVYGNSIWGAISASNGVVSGSAQFTGVLSSLNDYTASQNTKNVILASVTASYNTATASLNSFTSSQESKNVIIGNYTSSMNTFTASVNGHIIDINTKTGSLEAKNIIIGSYTSSMNTFTASVNGHISDINTKTGSFETKWATLQNVTSSILSYTSSLKSAIELTGSSVTILGNLVVKGTQLLVDSTTIQLGDNILELNGAASANGGLLVKDTTGTSGSLLWDSTNDYWKGGTIGNEEKLLRAGTDGVISGSLSSLNTFSASVNGHITDINTKTGSFETKFTTLGLYTASLDTKNTTLQTLTASMQAQVARLQESTASLNLYTSSQDTKNITLATYTASVSGHIVDINTKTGSFENKFTTLGIYTASLDTKNNTLGLYTASIDTKFSTLSTYTTSVDAKILRIQESTASLNTFSSSIIAFYNYFTASLPAPNSPHYLGGFSASVDSRLDQLEYTASYGSAATIADQFGALTIVTSSLQAASASLQLFTSSQAAKNIIIGSYTSSMNLFTASVETKFTTLQSLTASNLNRLTRIEESTASLNLYTSSNDTTNTNQNTRLSRIEESTASLNLYTSSIATAYEGRATATKTIFSGSSQVSYVGLSNIPSGIISSSAQIDTLFNIDGIVSGSSQINFTQLSGISPNIISSSSDTTNVDMIITGGSISANLYGGVVSGSAQVTTILTSLNSFSASNDNTSLNSATSSYETKGRGIVSGSSQINFTQLSGISNGIVSSSTQITPLLPTGVLSGSNQTNITSINQNLGTTSTGVQFATLGIGTAPDATYELKIAGDVAASGDIVAYYTSDKRLKDNIQPIQNALDKVNELGGYTFDWNEELQKARKGHDIGVIAQEVQSVLPEVVVERDNGYLGVDYQKLVPVLIEAIKELSAKIKDLENK